MVAGATVVARWTDNSVLVATGPLPGRADLNFYPGSKDAREDFWDTSTDGLKLMVNSLLYVMRPRVLLAGAPSDATWNDEVKTKLRATGLLGIVDIFHTGTGTPTLAQLKAYDAVLAYSDFPGFQNPTALGNALADFVDEGGGVVSAVFASSNGGNFRLGGRWIGTYELISGGSGQTGGAAALGVVGYPGHPAMSGVNSFVGGDSSYRQAGSALNSGAFRIASWSDGKPLIVASTRLYNRIDLGFFPPSSDSRADFWLASSDGGRVMANALLCTVKPNIACVAAELAGWAADPVAKLSASRRFSGVVFIDAANSTPAAATPPAAQALAASAFDNEEPVADKGVVVQAPWSVVQGRLSDALLGEKEFVRPAGGRQIVLDLAAMKMQLAGAPDENLKIAPGIQPALLVISLPRPDGSFERFEVVEYSIMEPALAAQFPDFKTYLGTSLDSPQSEARIDVTVLGFRAQVLSSEGCYWIDPVTMGDTSLYTSYRKSDLVQPQGWMCHVMEDPNNQHGSPVQDNPFENRSSTGPTRREYRLACAADGEYTAFFGGTVAAGQASIVTAVNRVTGVYEKDFAARLILVGNNSSLVFTNAATDPYTNTSPSALLTQNQSTCDSVIGTANYDIGHVFTTGGGGLAGLGVVCTAGQKARAETGLSSPTGDGYWIDYVGHEMGHQFGGNHTFNGNDPGNCGPNRNASTSVEPGSGSTIMAYAGICSPNDLQPHSDPYFVARSIQEITAYISSRSCQVNTSLGNSTPSVSAGSNFTIPIQTPYLLTGTGSDGNGDALTYCWEQNITSTAAQGITGGNFPDVGTNCYQRSFNPVSVPTRQFPVNANLLANTLFLGETLPSTSRAIPYRLTVRDGKGGQNFSDVTITSTTSSGPFVVTSPNTAVSYPALSTQTVTWNVANTNAAPVSCAIVDILISTYGGSTFPITLAAGVPNSGSAVVTMPNVVTGNARIQVKASANIFFDISNTNFSITAPNPVLNLAQFNGLLSWSDNPYLNPTLTGNQLADFVDAGGGVASALFANINISSNFLLGGRWPTQGYDVIPQALLTGSVTNSASLGAVLEPANPIVSFVRKLTGGSNNFHISGNPLLRGREVLRWSDGRMLAGVHNFRKRVELGTWPVSDAAYSGSWSQRTDGTWLIANALDYAIRHAPCPGDLNGDGLVNDDDFSIFIGYCNNLLDPRGDLTGDDLTEDADFTVFVGNYDALLCP